MPDYNIGTEAYDRNVAKGIEIETTEIYNLGLMLESQRGIDEVVEIYDFNEFRERFGDFDHNYYGAYAVDSFYDQIINAPTKLYVKRFVSDTAAASTATLQDIDATPEDTLTLEAGYRNRLDKGTWGDSVGYEIVHSNKAVTESSAASATDDLFITVDATADFEVGDMIKIDDTTPIYKKITSIDESEKKLYFSTTIGAVVPVDTEVLSINFNLLVRFRDRKGVVSEPPVETWEFLSMEPEVSGYVEKIINDEYDGSKYLYATDEESTSEPELTIPAETTDITYLASGSNGASPTDNDWYNELENFDNKPVRILINAESQTDKVNEDGMSYCKGKGNCVWIAAGPIDMTFAEAKLWGANFVGSELKYGLGYMQWISVDDPIGQGANPLFKIPATGALCGYWMQDIFDRGFHKNPAGFKRSIKGMRQIVQNKETERDTNIPKKVTELANYGVNVLQKKPRAGFIFKTARTFSNDKRFKWAANILMIAIIKESVKVSIEQSEMEPLGFPWLREVKTAIDNYMRILYRGSTNGGAQSAFFQGYRDDGSPYSYDDVVEIIANESNNTNADLLNGIANVYLYFVPPPPAERIAIGVGIPIIKKEG